MKTEDHLNNYYDNYRTLKRTIYTSFFLLFLIFIVLNIVPRSFIQVKSGEMGIQYRFFTGTDQINVYNEGLHIIWPINKLFIYDMRLQSTKRSYTLLTKGGLPIDVNVNIQYHPDPRLLTLLHIYVGPDFVEKSVIPGVEQALRKEIGKLDAEEVYTTKRGFISRLVLDSMRNVEQSYVIIDNVLVENVSLPPTMNDAVIKKLSLAEELKGYEYRLELERKEAERKLIEAQGIRNYQNLIGQTLTADILRWHGIKATKELATSPNAKTVVIGGGKDGQPLMLNER